MSSLKFCANLSWMFTELQGFPQRMYAAAAAGFQAVEAAWLYDADINELKEAKRRTGLRVVLINTPPGDIKAGELGLGAVPGRQAEFRRGLESAVTLAKALDCSRAPWILLRGVAVHHFMATPYRELRKMAVRALRAEKEGHKSMYITEEHSGEAKIEDAATVNRSDDGKTVKTGILALLESPQKGQKIHLMAGRVPLGMDRACIAMEMEATFIDNLKFAADVLSEEGILGLIEPINTRITDPQYFLETPPQAASILQKVGRSNIKLQMDIFHWQIMDGNLTQNIQKYFPIIGHVQIAQVPDRNEPDSSGEVNFPYLFDLLETVGYKGYIGCEYKPNSTTEAGLGWLREYWTNHKTKDAGVPSCPSDP